MVGYNDAINTLLHGHSCVLLSEYTLDDNRELRYSLEPGDVFPRHSGIHFTVKVIFLAVFLKVASLQMPG